MIKILLKLLSQLYAFFLQHIDAGNISDRLAIKNKLNCKDFGWYLKNIWPELLPYGEDVFSWGSVSILK